VKQTPLRLAVLSLVLCATDSMSIAEPLLVGSRSCATSAFHGGVVGRGEAWNSSHSVWYAQDPHAWAGLLLFNDASRIIVANLDPSVPHRDDTTETNAHGFRLADTASGEYQRLISDRCVSCHVTTSAAELARDPKIDRQFLARGVACESCHGPASDWLDSHYGLGATNETMRATEGWLLRIDGCVRCHVGSRSEDDLVRDMNHDLVAAGHPALRFEATLFSMNMPRHWSPGEPSIDASRRPKPKPNASIRFESGRWQTLAAVARLSSERLEAHSREPSKSAWPELAEYDCFACHHDLKLDRGKSNTTRVPQWNPWYLAGLDDEPSHQAGPSLRALPLSATDSQAEIPRQVEANARRRALASQSSNSNDPPIAVLWQALRAPTEIHNWYDASAWYLRVNAALQDCEDSPSMPAATASRIRSELDSLVMDSQKSNTSAPLFFGDGFESPHQFQSELFQIRRQSIIELVPAK